MKKTFPCGHTGAADRAVHQVASATRTSLQKMASDLRIDTDRYPARIIERAATIYVQVVAGGLPALRNLGAKKINAAKQIMSVPIGRRYRMLFDVESGAPVYMGLYSHADYDTVIGHL